MRPRRLDSRPTGYIRPRLGAALLGGLVAVTAAAPVTAQPRGDAAAAEALFEEGRKAVARGDHALACSKFEASQALDPGVGTSLNLAACREALGDLAAAWAHMRAAVAELGPTRDERLAFAKKRLAELDRRVPRLTIRLDPSAPPGARVRRDGAELPAASLGSALPLNPGSHTIEADVPGFAPRRFQIELAEGARKEISVAPVAPDAPAEGSDPIAPAAGAPETPGGTQRTLGWISVVVGGVGLGAGIVSGIVALDAKATLDEGCSVVNGTGERACDPVFEGDLERYNLTRTLSYTSFGVGAAGLALGIVLLATAPSAPATSNAGAGARRSAPRVAPWIAPGLAGVCGVF